MLGNIAYELYQLSSLTNPHINLLFPDIKNSDEIQEFFIDNENQIQDLINTLNELPYESISIYDWMILQDNTIDADGKEIPLDDVFDNKQVLMDFFKEDIEYITKQNDEIYIGTDTAIDYSQGIVWLGTEKTVTSSRDNIYYTKHLSGSFWIFEERE